jgi:hypothetical protein
VKDTNLTESHLLTDEVNVNLNVLRSSMMNWIGSHIDCNDVITKDERRFGVEREVPEEVGVANITQQQHEITQYSASALERETVVWRFGD